MSVLVTDFNKVNVVVKANLTLEQATKAQIGIEVKLYTFFNFDASWCGRTTQRPRQLTPGEDPVPIVLEAGWVSQPV